MDWGKLVKGLPEWWISDQVRISIDSFTLPCLPFGNLNFSKSHLKRNAIRTNKICWKNMIECNFETYFSVTWARCVSVAIRETMKRLTYVNSGEALNGFAVWICDITRALTRSLVHVVLCYRENSLTNIYINSVCISFHMSNYSFHRFIVCTLHSWGLDWIWTQNTLLTKFV